MLAIFLTDLTSFLGHPLGWLFIAFNLWMLVDAFRREEWMWVAFIILFPVLNAVLYYFMVYRAAPSSLSPSRGFELPGQRDRGRIAELEKQIHLLDKAHHHLELADIRFQQGKLKLAEESYLRALEREPKDIDARAHYGQCLLQMGRATEARAYLEDVCIENPKHDYGHSLMALAETRAALGETDGAIAIWEQVVSLHSYARARIQLAELLLSKGQKERARKLAEEVISEDKHAPEYQRKQEKPWIARSKKLLRDC
ncbi:MAG: tetratricopeptide repeat protein [Limisphaerales bacterium]